MRYSVELQCVANLLYLKRRLQGVFGIVRLLLGLRLLLLSLAQLLQRIAARALRLRFELLCMIASIGLAQDCAAVK